MGIPNVYGALLVRAKREGIDFARTATIGRQSLKIPKKDLAKITAPLELDLKEWDEIVEDGYADVFLTRCLGAESVTSFDYSDYQGVSQIHDFNEPIDQEFHESFDVVIDGGSMEHIFDVRRVLGNYMAMVKVGGSIFIHTPANNLVGHGFYQFSPELFCRVFSVDNGFRVEHICLTESPFSTFEASRRQRCFETRDPKTSGKRIRLVNQKPLMVFVHAQRVEKKPLFQKVPVQSDYSVKWLDPERGHRDSAGPDTLVHFQDGAGKPQFQHLSWWQEVRRTVIQWRKHSLRNRKYFRPFRF